VDLDGQLARVLDKQSYLPFGPVRLQRNLLGPYADFADLCPELIFALAAELDEGDDDGQAAEEGAG